MFDTQAWLRYIGARRSLKTLLLHRAKAFHQTTKGLTRTRSPAAETIMSLARILIADDYDDNRELLRLMLESAGYSV
ncbi:MAG TPA: response regulator, partial [Pyrinomonadaceae bacterium]